jgi:hypothetical protein
MKRVLYFGAIAAGVAALSTAAFASHGKVGLWDVTTTMNMGGMQMPDLSKLPPDQRAMVEAQLKKSGVSMNGNTITTQHCMTAAEVAQDTPPAMEHMKNCTVEHMNMSGGGMTADMVCSTSELTGSGHISVSYSGDSQYSGSMNFSGTAQGHPINMTNSFQGKWVSADCGGVTH